MQTMSKKYQTTIKKNTINGDIAVERLTDKYKYMPSTV